MTDRPQLTAEEAAWRLNLSLRRVQQICSSGHLGRRHGRRSFIITEAELQRFSAVPRKPGPKPTKQRSLSR